MLVLYKKRRLTECQDCDGTSWRFTAIGEESGFRWKKVGDLSTREIEELPCAYFERCPCGYEEQVPKSPGKKVFMKDIMNLLNIKLPTLGYSFQFQELRIAFSQNIPIWVLIGAYI